MSKLRVEIDVFFETQQDAIELLNHIENIKTKAYNPIGNEGIPIRRMCRYHKCFHDEKPPKPCENYTTVNFEEIKKIHTVLSVS